MRRKIFVSYKYGDSDVLPLNGHWYTTVRHYIDALQELLAADHINKGENDDESLEGFKDTTIESKLRDKIFDSSITIVAISPTMKDPTPESDQWIPWEIAYSLREQTRGDRTSGTNAVLAVVLPDRTGSYAYFLDDMTCCVPGCRLHKTHTLFQILRENMFNAGRKSPMACTSGNSVFTGECSYMPAVKWTDFVIDVDRHLDRVVSIREHADEYTIVKTVT